MPFYNKELNLRESIVQKDSWINRFLTSLPGFLTVILFTSPLWLGLTYPNLYATILFAYIILWIAKTFRTYLFVIYTLWQVRKNNRINWQEKVEKLPLYNESRLFVVIPFATEPLQVVEPCVSSMLLQNFDTKKVTLCLTTESKFEKGRDTAEKLKNKYISSFENILINSHTLVSGEVAGKSSNVTSGCHMLQEYIDANGWNEEDIVLLSCDSDSVFPPNYFAILFYKFLTEPNKHTTFWAAPHVYQQNYWDIPILFRTLHVFNAINNIANVVRTHTRFIHISTFSGSWKFIKSLGFYDPAVVSDDYHIFFVALFTYFSKVRTDTIYQIVDSDAVDGYGFVDTLRRAFRQIQRWAWGVEDYPFIVKNLFKVVTSSRYQLKDKLYVLLRTSGPLYDHQFWPFNGVIFPLFSTIIWYLARPNMDEAFWFNLTNTVIAVFNVSAIFSMGIVVMTYYLRPKAELTGYSFFGKIFFYLVDLAIILVSIIVLPILSFFIAGISSLTAHYRLFTRNYLGFVLTEKK
jgi:hypothetical protein